MEQGTEYRPHHGTVDATKLRQDQHFEDGVEDDKGLHCLNRQNEAAAWLFKTAVMAPQSDDTKSDL
jgi:hypothetical protein